MSLSIYSNICKTLTLHLIICCLSCCLTNGQYYNDPYPATSSINRFGYRYGNSPNYGSKFGYPYNSGQYYDPNRPMVNSADPLVDANNYWRHYRERYPPSYPTSAYPSSSMQMYSTSVSSSPMNPMSQGLPPLSQSMLPPPPPPPPPSSQQMSPPGSSSSSSSPSGQGSSGSPQQSPSSQSPLSGPSSMSGQPPISNFDTKYGLLPGPANFADSTVTFDHRFGWVPRYPNYVLPPGANYFPSTGHPYSYPSNPPYPNHRVARGVAEIRGSDNKVTGTINFEQEENEHVIIRGKILGLPPGAHGMHVLEKPLTGNDCSSGGDHYNPQKTEHGGKHDWIRHVGDLGNIFADRDGIAYFDLTDQIISLTGGYSVFNRTIVITEKPDDLGRSGDLESKRTGNSGSAIACGTIQVAKF
ncbi:trithorax group protein osa-like [Panonychus citri]|uniref:trithorax group protein osa-like n=1 Tax=Panonychus citri TaxID=50023 RepID=UPI0023079767|nr:trithorax group protein osa-like [Panonychus citri]